MVPPAFQPPQTPPGRFIGQAIKPVIIDTSGMAVGKPGIPTVFVWQGERYRIVRILDQWRETSPCSHGSDERYVRKHWLRIQAETGDIMRLYFERQTRHGRRRGRKSPRWFLFSIEENTQAGPTE
ncbi:MAG: DUF6504 family protein [Candidatus Sumerlaeota bacterium]